VIAAVVATGGFAQLVGDRPAGRGASVWFAAVMCASVVSGRMPFTLGCAFAIWAIVAASRGHAIAAGLLAALTALASPVAAMFLALAGVAWWWSPRDEDTPPGPPLTGLAARAHPRAPLSVAAAAIAVVALLVAAFPAGGSEPFVPSAFWPCLAACGVAYWLAPAGRFRTGIALYALLLVAAFAIPSPIGGNAVRLGALLSGPLGFLVLWPRRRRLFWLLALPMVWWGLYPPARDWIESETDPATHASYFAPVVAELARREAAAPTPGRVEVPFTGRHWEAAHVASAVPLARGWERQYDRKVNDVFYKGKLTPARYDAWLRENAIRWVALPDAHMDPSAITEAHLVGSGQPFLQEVWRSEHWRLYAVRDAVPIGVTALRPDGFDAPGAGLVRIRFSPYWAVIRGQGCVERAAGGWTRVRASGPVTVGMRFAPGRIVSRGPRCTT